MIKIELFQLQIIRGVTMVTNVKIRDAAAIPSLTGTEVIEIDNLTATYYKTTPDQLTDHTLKQPIVLYKGAISLPADFPTLVNVKVGWTYHILVDVTDSDVTKTHTLQSFLGGDEILWNGSNWYAFGASELLQRIGTTLSPVNAGDNFYTSSYYKAGRADGGIFEEGSGFVSYGKNLENDVMDANNYGYLATKQNLIQFSNVKTSVTTTPFKIDLTNNIFTINDNSGNITFDFNRLTGALKLTQNTVGVDVELGTPDAYTRYQIWNRMPNAILRLGSLGSDGDTTTTSSEGAVIYGQNVQSDPMSVSDFSYARIKPGRIALYNAKNTGYTGYLFRLDVVTNEFYLKDNSGNTTYNMDRSTGIGTYYGIQDYNSHPSFTVDTQIVDKKYVDDHPGTASVIFDNLSSQILVGGETNFTISYTPNTPGEALLFLNGQKRTYGVGEDFSISGTTLTWNDPGGLTLVAGDKFHVYYDYSIGGAPLTQDQIYYVGEAGDDSYHGKNYQFPVKTLTKAIALVNAMTPSSTNRFEIQIIGGMILTENVTIPTYTKVVGLSAKLTGTVTLSAESALQLKELVVPNSANGLVANAVTVNCDLDKLSGGTSSVGIYAHTGGIIRANIREVDLSGAGSKFYNLATGGVIYLNADRLRENTTSTDDGSGSILFDVNDYGSNADKHIYNDVGDIVIETYGGNISLKDTVGGEILTNVGKYHKFTNAPSFEAYENVGTSDVTGDGSNYTVIFENEIRDVGSNYNPVTGIFTAPVSGEYLFTYTIALTGFTDHTFMEIYLVGGVKTYYSFYGSPLNIKSPGNSVFKNGSHKVYLNVSDQVYVNISVGGGSLTKSIDMAGSNFCKFSGILLTT